MILYLGNNLKSKSVTETTMTLLAKRLKQEQYDIKLLSSKKNKFLRLLSMSYGVIRYRTKIRYVLIDTYSTQNFYYAYITSQLCRRLKLSYIPILHGGNLPSRLKSSKRISKHIFDNAYVNIAPSLYLKTEFEKVGFKVEYIPNIIEIKNYNYKERGISTPKLLYVRAFAHIYNPTMAIKVLISLKKEYPNAKLCMVGPEKDNSYQACMEMVKKNNLEECVEFTGKLSKQEWREKSEAFNIFINTTTIDNTPVSVIEAMALGMPVVTTNVGGIPYLIKNKEDGLLVNNNDVDKMVASIKMLCTNKELVSTITKNARKKVEKFDWEHVKRLWINILK